MATVIAFIGLLGGLALIVVGLDGLQTRTSAIQWIMAALPLLGLGLVAAAILVICVPGFFTW